MSEKRFEAVVDDKGHLQIITDSEIVLNNSYEVVNLLNIFSKRVEKLENELRECKDASVENNEILLSELNILKEENEQLKNTKKSFKECREENEQLRNLLDRIVSQIDNEYVVFPPITNEYSVKVNITGEEYDKIKEVVFNNE